MLPIVTDMFIQCRNVRSLAAACTQQRRHQVSAIYVRHLAEASELVA